MSDDTLAAIEAYFANALKPKPSPIIDSVHQIEMQRGKRDKRIIDMNRTNQNYYKSKTVHTPLLEHYENSYWYERVI